MRSDKFAMMLGLILSFSVITTILTHRRLNVEIDSLSGGSSSSSLSLGNAMDTTLVLDGEEDGDDQKSEQTDPDPDPATQTTVTTTTTNTSSSKFAYAFLIAGCDPSYQAYKGYIYNVAVAKQLFLNFGSTTDVVVMIRMHESSTSDKLPKEDEDLLTQMGIILTYLPRAMTDNFHTAMMDKFRILQLVQYERVLYLDADVIPLSNLEFMFQLSTGPNAPLQENVALAYNREPTNGGFFMLAPSEEDYQMILTIIEKREREGYHFNETIGWGHQMIPPDGWESLSGFQGSNWDFYGSFTDQGLIYYFTKYVKKKVTIINGSQLKTFLEVDGQAKLVREDDGAVVFKDVKKGIETVETNHHSRPKWKLKEKVPYRDFHHFKEEHKPWIWSKFKIDHGPHEYWFETLRFINEKYDFGIDVDKIVNEGLKKPNLGLFPTYNMVEATKNKRLEEDSKKAAVSTESVESVESVESTTNYGKFAYAFLIAGCDPKNPNYRGYIYSVAVAKQALINYGSTNDVVVMIRMHGNTKHAQLPESDARILKGMGIIVKYLPQALMDNFHTAMMDKFRILQLTEYERVLYLDADVIPLSNLDFMFDMSVGPNAPLQENVALAYNREPTNGGFFMLKPSEEDYTKVLEIIEKREREGYHFNETIGWGHQMIPPDGWESLSGFQGSNWDFYGSFTDQGLIYYWTKYVKKKVTIITGSRVKTYTEVDGTVQLTRDDDGFVLFKNVKKGIADVQTNHHSRIGFKLPLIVPYRDFHHFKEKFKPWLINAKHQTDHGPHEYWYSLLKGLNEEHGFGIDIKGFVEFRQPSLGLYPRFTMIEDMKRLREEKDEEEKLNQGS